MGGAGVSISSDFLPMGSSTRSRMLELNVEYRDRCSNLWTMKALNFNSFVWESYPTGWLDWKSKTTNPFRQWRHCYKQRYVGDELGCGWWRLSCQVGVPPCQQELRGWKGAAPFPVTGETTLATTPWYILPPQIGDCCLRWTCRKRTSCTCSPQSCQRLLLGRKSEREFNFF